MPLLSGIEVLRFNMRVHSTVLAGFPPDGCSVAIGTLCSQWTADCGLFLGLRTAVLVQMTGPLPATLLTDTMRRNIQRETWFG